MRTIVGQEAKGIARDWLSMFPQNSFVEVLAPSVTILENGACEEVVKDRWGHNLIMQVPW